jgi:hypothetical protein
MIHLDRGESRNGVMEDWSGGVVECWSAGVLECWSAGVLECWSAGVLECWSKNSRVKSELESQDRLLAVPSKNRKEFATDDKGEIGRFILQLLNSCNS